MENLKKNVAKTDSINKGGGGKPKDPVKEAGKEPGKPAGPVAPIKVPPMFRPNDWLALLIAFGTVWAVYLWTLAPELTLEDSGELCTASYYAGIPHPPGYPFWAIYSWIWTVIVPFGNVAWRVEVGQSFASAMGCGLLALMVSRGGSMLIEGIDELKSLERRWGTGDLHRGRRGGGDFVWLGRVHVEGIGGDQPHLDLRGAVAAGDDRPVDALDVCAASAPVPVLCDADLRLVRHDPSKLDLVRALGIEVLIAMVLPRLGRDMFTVNSIVYLIVLFYKSKHTVPALEAMTFTEQTIFNTVGLFSVASAVWLFIKTNKLFTEWASILIMGAMCVLGVSVYFYSAVSCMSVPPMQWGYPRTVEGFFHMLSRGQYGTGEGTNVLQDPSRFPVPAVVSRRKACRNRSVGFTCSSAWCRSCSSKRCSGGNVPGSSA